MTIRKLKSYVCHHELEMGLEVLNLRLDRQFSTDASSAAEVKGTACMYLQSNIANVT